jgi:hypothetical protein
MDFDAVVDYGSWKVGEVRDESSKAGKLSRTRLTDDMVKVGEKRLDCIVVLAKAQTSDGGTTVENKSWFAKSSEVPGLGVVKIAILPESPPTLRLRQQVHLIAAGKLTLAIGIIRP